MTNRKCASPPPSDPVAGVEVGIPAKIELIRKFQRTEGNFDCFASTYTRVCKQFECLWRDDCLAMAQG